SISSWFGEFAHQAVDKIDRRVILFRLFRWFRLFEQKVSVLENIEKRAFDIMFANRISMSIHTVHPHKRKCRALTVVADRGYRVAVHLQHKEKPFAAAALSNDLAGNHILSEPC